MRRAHIFAVLGLIAICCIVILFLQYHWFSSVRSIAKKRLENQVSAALINVALELKHHEVTRLVIPDTTISLQQLKNERPEFYNAPFNNLQNSVLPLDSVAVVSFEELQDVTALDSGFQMYSLSKAQLTEVVISELGNYKAVDGYLIAELAKVNVDPIISSSLHQFGVKNSYHYAITSFDSKRLLLHSEGFKEESKKIHRNVESILQASLIDKKEGLCCKDR